MKLKAKKRGNKFGFWFFKMLVHTTGLRGAYGFLYIICLHYLIFDRQAVRVSLAYIEKKFPEQNRFVKYLHVYRLFISQGKNLIDRYAALNKVKEFNLQLDGYNEMTGLVKNREKGFILLTSHFGNWQIALPKLKKLHKKVYLVMRPEDNRAVRESLQIDKAEGNIGVISAEESLDGAFKIINILKQGGIVCIMGDRHYEFNSIEVRFLGNKARFPYGAFTIASSLKCPVVALLSAKVSAGSYKIDTTNIFYPEYKSGVDKKEQIRNWVKSYVEVLEGYIEKYPYQCFLFHDVWS